VWYEGRVSINEEKGMSNRRGYRVATFHYGYQIITRLDQSHVTRSIPDPRRAYSSACLTIAHELGGSLVL